MSTRLTQSFAVLGPIAAALAFALLGAPSLAAQEPPNLVEQAQAQLAQAQAQLAQAQQQLERALALAHRTQPEPVVATVTSRPAAPCKNRSCRSWWAWRWPAPWCWCCAWS